MSTGLKVPLNPFLLALYFIRLYISEIVAIIINYKTNINLFLSLFLKQKAATKSERL